jgi:hypothetical protein
LENRKSKLENRPAILSEDSMTFRLTTVHENARSALECDSEAAALKPTEGGS